MPPTSTRKVMDLGDNHSLVFIAWAPDRKLNPQYDGIPDTNRWGAVITHLTPDGKECTGIITFDGEIQRKVQAIVDKWHRDKGQEPPEKAFWTVESWDPLTISPSVLCLTCQDHGFVRNGKWVRA